MKKRIILSSLMIIGIIVNGQVAIGKIATNKSALLDFKEGTKSGIILPQISNFLIKPSNPEGIFYDCHYKQVFFKHGGSYYPLSDGVKDQQKVVCKDTSSIQEIGNGVVIGANNNNTAKGVLVLESDDKALLLPKVANAYSEIKSPAPGTLVYDPTNKVVSVYDGETWSFLTNQ